MYVHEAQKINVGGDLNDHSKVMYESVDEDDITENVMEIDEDDLEIREDS